MTNKRAGQPFENKRGRGAPRWGGDEPAARMRRRPQEIEMRSVFQAKSARGVWVALSLFVAMLLPLAGGRAAGATASDPNDPNAASSSNTVSTGTFEVSGGTPGSWIQAALTRHKAFIGARVDAARNGERPGVQWGNGTTGTTAGTTTDATTSTGSSSSTLDSLSSLLSQLGGSSSSLGSLSSLLSGLTGTSSSTTSGSTASKSSAAQQSVNSTTPTDSTGATSSSADATAPFCEQLANSLLDTLLSALTTEFQSTAFRDFLKTQLEALILPPASSQTSGANTSGG